MFVRCGVGDVVYFRFFLLKLYLNVRVWYQTIFHWCIARKYHTHILLDSESFNFHTVHKYARIYYFGCDVVCTINCKQHIDIFDCETILSTSTIVACDLWFVKRRLLVNRIMFVSVALAARLLTVTLRIAEMFLFINRCDHVICDVIVTWFCWC